MSVEQILDDAFRSYNAGDLGEAEALARHALSLQNTHGDALYLLALIAIKAGAQEKASEILYTAVKLYPNIENYQLLLASVLDSMGRLHEALEIYEKYQNNPIVLTQIGYIYLKRAQYDTAQRYFDKVLSDNPLDTEALLGQAALNQKTGKPYQNILKNILKREENVDAYYRLSQYAYHHKKYQEALDYISKAVQLTSSSTLYNQQGLCLEALGDLPEALKCYQRAIETNPYDDTTYFNKGNVLARLNQLDESEISYKQSIKHNPKNFDAFYRLGLLLFQRNKPLEALENLHSALLLQPDNPDALYALAVAVEQSWDYSEAVGLYFNILSLTSEKTGISKRIQHCLVELAKSDEKQAKEFANGWVKNFPDNKTAQQTLRRLNTIK